MPLIPTALQNFMLGLINEARAAAGLRALALDAELTTAAQGHAQWMVDADVFSHTGQGGSTPAQRGTTAGYQWTRYGENVAYIAGNTAVVLNETDVRQLHTNLMNSPGHRANILSAAFTQVGIGLAQGDYQGRPAVFVAQTFGTPTAAELADGTGIAEPQPEPAPTTPTPPAEPTPPPAPTTPTVPAPASQAVRVQWTGAGYETTIVPAG